MIRVVLIDREPSVRQGLKMRLELTKGIHIVGETDSGDAALAMVRDLAPDVVVTDIELAGIDGILLTRTLCEENKRASIVILSMRDDPETRARGRAAGADAFVSKHEGTAALLKAIREAAQARPGPEAAADGNIKTKADT